MWAACLAMCVPIIDSAHLGRRGPLVGRRFGGRSAARARSRHREAYPSRSALSGGDCGKRFSRRASTGSPRALAGNQREVDSLLRRRTCRCRSSRRASSARRQQHSARPDRQDMPQTTAGPQLRNTSQPWTGVLHGLAPDRRPPTKLCLRAFSQLMGNMGESAMRRRRALRPLKPKTAETNTAARAGSRTVCPMSSELARLCEAAMSVKTHAQDVQVCTISVATSAIPGPHHRGRRLECCARSAFLVLCSGGQAVCAAWRRCGRSSACTGVGCPADMGPAIVIVRRQRFCRHAEDHVGVSLCDSSSSGALCNFRVVSMSPRACTIGESSVKQIRVEASLERCLPLEFTSSSFYGDWLATRKAQYLLRSVAMHWPLCSSISLPLAFGGRALSGLRLGLFLLRRVASALPRKVRRATHHHESRPQNSRVRLT